jgi:hypothetical protein
MDKREADNAMKEAGTPAPNVRRPRARDSGEYINHRISPQGHSLHTTPLYFVPKTTSKNWMIALVPSLSKSDISRPMSSSSGRLNLTAAYAMRFQKALLSSTYVGVKTRKSLRWRVYERGRRCWVGRVHKTTHWHSMFLLFFTMFYTLSFPKTRYLRAYGVRLLCSNKHQIYSQNATRTDTCAGLAAFGGAETDCECVYAGSWWALA